MRESLSHRRNQSFNLPNMPQISNNNTYFPNQKDQAISLRGRNSDLSTISNNIKSKNINENFSNFQKELSAINYRSENNFLGNAVNLHINDNNPNTYSLGLRHSRNAFLSNSISSADLIEEKNIIQLNEKLKAASEFYHKRNKSTEYDVGKCEISNQALGKSIASNNDNNNNESKMHVSKYIKKFLHQAHEDFTNEEENNVFSRIHYKCKFKIYFF